MPPTAEFEFIGNNCMINCQNECRCESKKGQNVDTINNNANEIIAKGQNLFSNALRTLRWSKSKIIVNNNVETVLNEEKCRPIISLKEVAEHDSYDDCWIILYDRVYDVTQFLNEVNSMKTIACKRSNFMK